VLCVNKEAPFIHTDAVAESCTVAILQLFVSQLAVDTHKLVEEHSLDHLTQLLEDKIHV